MTRNASLAAVVLSAACFSTLGILTRMALSQGAAPSSVLVWRFAMAAVLLGLFQLARSPRALLVSGRDLTRFGLLSLTGYGIASLCYAYAVLELGASITTVLLFTYPAFVCLIGAVFLREPLPPRRIASIVLTFAGCVLVAGLLGGRAPLALSGVALGLCAGLGYAAFTVLSHRVVVSQPRTVIMAYTFGISALGLCLFATVTNGIPSAVGWTPMVWAAVGLMVLVPTFAAVSLYLVGIKGLGAPQAALVSTLEMPFTIVLAAVALGERLAPTQWLGAGVVLVGVVLAEWGAAGVAVEVEAGPAA